MRTTITVRTDVGLRSALARRAKAVGKSISEVVRELLTEALAERSVGARAGHLRGTLRLSSRERRSPEHGAWRRRIRERNWRP